MEPYPYLVNQGKPFGKKDEPIKESRVDTRRSRKGSLRRQIVVSLVAIVVVAAGVGIFVYAYFVPFFGAGSSTGPQPLPTVQPTVGALIPTDVQSFKDSHGPWLSTQGALSLQSQTGVRNLALFESNGSIGYSEKSAKFDGSAPWVLASTPPELAGVTLQGTSVTIATQKGVTYTLNVTQPFILDGVLSRVYLIDATGKLWSAPTADLSFVSAKSVSDSKLGPNPGLSTSIGS